MMKKYIITAKSEADIINLSRNTKGVDLSKVKWDWANIARSDEDARCGSEQEILDAIGRNDLHDVDDMIMGGDVPVGGMVVVFDKDIPKHGFVCGNGIDWFVYDLKKREANAIAYGDALKNAGEGV
jgi:hypothetical protein